MLKFVVFSYLIFGTTMAFAQSEGLWRQALGEYTDESLDYIDTLSETRLELKFWRQKVLQERFDGKLSRFEKMLSEGNVDFLKQIESFINKDGREGLDDSLLMRVAQLYFDRANYDVNFKMKKYEDDMLQFQIGKLKKAPVLPIPQYEKTLAFSRDLLVRFPMSPLSDKAHYLMGYCWMETAQVEKAREIFARLLKSHPYSNLVPEVRWRLAEIDFERGQYADAGREYKVLSAVHSTFTLKAKYKMAATLFAQGSYEKAATEFMALTKLSQAERSTDNPDAETIYEEALDYLAHLKAKGVQLNMDEPMDALVTEHLANAYRRVKDEDGFRKTYLNFSAARPMARRTPHFMNEVIESYEGEDKSELAQGVRDRFIIALGPESLFWSRYKEDVNISTEALDYFETNLLASGQYYGEKAKRTKSRRDLEFALRYYSRFVKEYPYSDFWAQAKYEMAELSYFFGDYAKSSPIYKEVASDASNQDYRSEAAYGYVLSELKKSGQTLAAAKKLSPSRDKQGLLKTPSVLTNSEREFFKAVEFFGQIVPSGVRRQRVLYRAAEVFFTHNQFDKTRESLEMLLRDRVVSSVSISALRLMAETYDLENKWDRVVETNRRLASFAQGADGDTLENDLSFKVGSHALQEAFALENAGRLTSAAEMYESFATRFPFSGDAPYALFRAARLYRETSQFGDSERNLDRLLKEYRNSKYQAEGEFIKAANQASLIQFASAAHLYESFGLAHPRHPLSPQAFLNSATLYKNLKQPKKAAENFEQYAKRSSDENTWFDLIRLKVKAGDRSGALRILSRYESGQMGLNLRVRALFEKALISSTPEALSSCKKVKALTADASHVSAYSKHSLLGCQYILTWPKRDRLLKSKINIESISALIKDYDAIIKEGDKEWAAAAMADTGRIYETQVDKTPSLEEKDLFRQKAAEYYGKAIVTSENNPYVAAYEDGMDGLRRVTKSAGGTIQADLLWPNASNFPQDIEVRWPPAPSALKVAFDQRKWRDVLASTKMYIPKDQSAYLYSAQARAQAELGQWDQAKATLEECVQKTSDEFCAAGFLASGFSSTRLEELKTIVKKTMKRDSHPSWKLALAQVAARQGQADVAEKYIQELVKESPEWAPSYIFLSQLYLELGRPELSKITVDQGERNTESDERLRIQKGYISLNLHLDTEVKEVTEDMRSQERLSTAQRIFVAHSLMAQGEKAKAIDALGELPGNEPDRTKVQISLFTLAMIIKDMADLQNRAKSMEEISQRDPYGAYVYGTYLHHIVKNSEEALRVLAKSRELGQWGRGLDDVQIRDSKNRQPARLRGPEND